MRIGLRLSFTEISLDEAYVSSFIKQHLRFEPYAYSYDINTKPWNEKQFFSKVNEFRSVYGISTYDLNRHIIIVGKTGTKIPHLSLMIEQDKALFLPEKNEMYDLINNEGFICAYLYDADYVDIQSTKFVNNYIEERLPPELHNTIKNTPFKHGMPGTKEYDITHNPGRQTLIGYTWLMACWKMWFGSEFYKLVPKEKIIAFPDAERIEELPNDIVFVQLFKEVTESHLPQNMALQQKWRDWLEFDRLEREYK